MENQRYIYVVISKTATKFGYVLRKVGKVRYNHASVALDAELNEWYSFARKQYQTVLLGGCVLENMERYTLRKTSDVQVVIFRIPVTVEQYCMLRNTVYDIKNDEEYMYNLLSVLTWPLTKGFSTYKAYSCIEFTMTMLGKIGFSLDKPMYRYTPDELLGLLSEYAFFQGNLLDYKAVTKTDDTFFQPMTFRQIIQSGFSLKEIMKRSFLLKNS